jgi:hypothetical protein
VLRVGGKLGVMELVIVMPRKGLVFLAVAEDIASYW